MAQLAAQMKNGEWVDVYKNTYGKESKRGMFKLIRTGNGNYETVSYLDPRPDVMEDVFIDGELIRDLTFDEVREYARIPVAA